MVNRKGKLKKSIVMGTAALFMAMSAPSFAADLTAETVLIKKLQSVLARLPKADPSRKDILLRMADLHAEKARLLSMEELEKGCTTCDAGNPDRKQAIALYEEVLSDKNGGDKGSIYTQLGHLYELVGEKDKAIAAYQENLKTSKDELAIGEGNLSMGEIYFRKGDFRRAIQHYDKVLANKKAGGRGLAAYRRSWSFFNLNDDVQASRGMIEILQSPQLLSRGVEPGIVKPDPEFQAEVSRDLATFYGRQSVTLDQAKQLFELSPKAAARANTAYLAKELERMGKIGSAIQVWRFVLSKQTSPKEKLTGLTLLAQLEMAKRMREPAISDYHQALATWQAVTDCQNKQDPVCNEIKTRLKNFLIKWNQEEEQKPSKELLQAYVGYLKIFPGDTDMSIYAGLVSREHKQYPQAFAFFDRAGQDIVPQLAAPNLEKKKSKELQDKLEGTLLNQIEVAELSKDKSLLKKAYARFLAHSQDTDHKFKVQYQLAYMTYEEGDYTNAALALNTLATTPGKTHKKIKRQAADLALDALVLLKDDTRIESWATNYGSLFKDGAKEFNKVARTSLMNQAAAVAQGGSLATAGLEKSWVILTRVSLDGASETEKIDYYRNRAVLAEKLGKWDELDAASKKLLAIPGLKAEDREFATGKLAWSAELRLNFSAALDYSKKLKMASLSQSDRHLRLAMLADLADADSSGFLRSYLKVSKDSEKNFAIATRLVNESKNPEKEVRTYNKILSTKPQFLARFYLERYAEKPSAKAKKMILGNKELAATNSGQILKREDLLAKISREKKTLLGHQIDTRSQGRLGRSLKKRIKLLEKWEKLTAQALQSKDWIAQAACLQILSNESQRLFENILALPMPKGLTPEEQTQYLGLLSEQAAPHQARAQEVGQKAQEFWNNQQATQRLGEMVASETGAIRTLLKNQLNVAAAVAPETLQQQWQTQMGEPKAKPTQQPKAVAGLAEARKEVSKDPLNLTKLRLLMGLEKQSNNPVMVSYLEGRVAKGMASSPKADEQGGKK